MGSEAARPGSSVQACAWRDSSLQLVTLITWATLRANDKALSNTPTPTPRARLRVQTTTTTVATITKLVLFGWMVKFLNDDHEKVPIETMIITATRAGIGIWRT